MRLPYTANPPNFSTEDEKAILSRVQARRGPRGLIPLDLALLHAPQIADGWNSLLGAVRTRSSLPGDVREVAIARVAVLNQAWFEWGAHGPLAREEGVSEEGVLGLLDTEGPAGTDPSSAGYKKGLDDKLLAVKVYTDEMTRNVAVPQAVFDGVRKYFNDQEMVELTATISAYNCVSRFLVALDVAEANGKKPSK